MNDGFSPNNPMTRAEQFAAMKQSITILKRQIEEERDNYKKDTMRSVLRGWEKRFEQMELTSRSQ